jgi:dienelactone hydrolase
VGGNRRIPRLNRTPITVLACLAVLFSGPAHAQQYVGRLYQGPPPGSADWSEPLTVHKSADGEERFNVSDPRIQVFLPDVGKANGAAVVLLPGGGLRVLGIGEDTRETISRFNAEGVAVALLEYRTLQLSPEEIERATAPRPASAQPMTFPKLEIRRANANPAPENEALNEVLRLAVMDAQQALRLLRMQASAWNIDPARVGLFGTSAGGGVAFGTMLAGEEGATPDFIVSNYGPALQDVVVPQDAPPLFLITEAAHGPVTDGLVALFEMWKDRGEHAELHVYDVPNFSMRVSLWGDRLFDWLRSREIIPQRDHS